MSQIKKTKFLPPYGVVACMVVMYLLASYFPILLWHGTKIVAYVLMSSSFLCILFCAYIFHKHKTEIKPFEESSFLILSWPYTVSRNPIYFCMNIFLLGWAVFLQALSAFVIIPIFALWIHYRFVLQEEIMLQDKFSDDYLAYKNKVRRWC